MYNNRIIGIKFELMIKYRFAFENKNVAFILQQIINNLTEYVILSTYSKFPFDDDFMQDF